MTVLYSTQEVAEMTGLSLRRIQQLGPELADLGHATKVGSVLVCYESALDYITGRPERRGRPKKK